MRVDESGIRGIGSFNGGTYKNFKIAGSATINEDCKAEKIKIAGNADFKGSVTAKQFNVAGKCKVGGNVKVDKISIAGSFNGCGNLDAEEAKFAGIVEISGDVNCENFNANVTGSTFKNIYGESIVFEKEKNNGLRSKIDEIAATKVEVYNAEVNKISGEFVIIGDGCVVELVEYNNTLSVSRNARIAKIIKL